MVKLLGTLIALLCSVLVLQGAPGDLDPTFGGTGKMRLGFGGGDDIGHAIAIQTDGKAVVAVNSSGFVSGFSIRRYNSDGTLDTSFLGKDQVYAGTATALKLQPSDGKILVAGWIFGASTDNGDFLVMRFNVDGSLDGSFGTRGTVITPIEPGSFDAANDFAVQTDDDKIVVMGTDSHGDGSSAIGIVRYNNNGSLDSTFGDNGKTTKSLIGTDTGQAIVLSGSTIIIAGGNHSFDGSSFGFILFRLTANGAPDSTFNNGSGYVVTPLGADVASANALAIQPAQPGHDATIVAAGTSSGKFTLVRYNLDGTRDTTFDGDGILVTGISGDAHALAIQKTGTPASPVYKIVIGGEGSPGFTVARYLSSGLPDSSFDGDGVAVTSFDPSNGGCRAIALSGTKIVAAGYAGSSQFDLALVRFNLNGSLDTSFDVDGKKVDDVSDKNAAVATTAAIQPDGKILVAGNLTTSSIPPARTYGLMRFNADGALDPSFGAGTGKVTAPFGTNETIEALALQADGKIITAGGSNGKAAVRRFATDGSLEQTLRSTFAGEAMAVAIQLDGKIVAAGTFVSPPNNTGPNSDFQIMRVVSNASDLSTDPSFGTNGAISINLGSSEDVANSVAIQTDGKIVAVGKSGNAFAAIRCNPDGSLDLSFRGNGKLTAQFGASQNEGKAVAIQGDGKIVIAGRADTSAVTVRYDGAGTLDGTFGSNGAVITPLSANTTGAEALALQPDGRLLVAGSDNGDFLVLRYNANGSLDSSFGVGGKAIIDVSGSADLAHAIVLDTSGRAIVAGEAAAIFGVTRIADDFAPAPTPTPAATATPTPTPNATPTPTPTPDPNGTPTPTPTPDPNATPTPTPTPTVTPGLVGNVSTRLPVGTGDNALIEGFIVQGPAGSTKKILVRAIGPSLAPFGIPDALANPILEIHDASANNATVATNDDWQTTQVGGLITGDQSPEIAASGVPPGNDLESAIIANLAPGSYTAVVRGVNDTVGTGVVDAYDLSAASPARLANISTRGLIQPGDKLMIAGFIIQNAPVRVAVLAIGPSLSAFGITNALQDTTLQLRDPNGAIVRENDDWQTDQKQELESIGLQPTNDLEAALVATIPPGQYTAQVRGKPETTGIGVVQVYFLQ
jgi:uncharacterized delta-60 repeat protein